MSSTASPSTEPHGSHGSTGSVGSQARRVRRPARATWARLVGAVVGGLALWQSWPRGDHWWAAIVGVALLALVVHGRTGRAGFGWGTLVGFAAFCPALSWSGIYVGPLPWLALAVLEALYVGLAGLMIARLTRPGGGARPVVVALAWTAAEMLRSTTPFGGFPWIKLAYSQADSPMLPLARLVSSVGLSFAVALAGGLLAAVLLPRRGTPATPDAEGSARSTGSARRGWVRDIARHATARRVGAGVGLVGLVAGPLLVPVPTSGPTVQVLAIQGDVPTAGLDFNAQRRAVLDHHVRQTLLAAQEVAAGRRPQPALVVWPENASDIDPLRNPDAGDEITRASVAIKAPIVVGGLRITPTGDIANTSWYWDGAKGPTADYSKRHPVPFGEYIPYRSFFRRFSDKVDLVRADMIAGTKVGVMAVPAPGVATPLRLGLGICFEVAYDDVLLDDIDHGATLLAIQTNNATFGYTDESYQQIAVSRIRAVEYGRSVVHVSTVGTSGMITPGGVVHEQTGLFEPGRLSMALPLRTERTPAAALGLWPGRVAVVLAALLLAADAVTGRRERRADREPRRRFGRAGATRRGSQPAQQAGRA